MLARDVEQARDLALLLLADRLAPEVLLERLIEPDYFEAQPLQRDEAQGAFRGGADRHRNVTLDVVGVAVRIVAQRIVEVDAARHQARLQARSELGGEQRRYEGDGVARVERVCAVAAEHREHRVERPLCLAAVEQRQAAVGGV